MESQRSENTSAVTQVVVPEMLVEGHVKKQCNLLGDIHNVPISLDIGNRSQILEILDNARRQGILPWEPSREHSVAMSLSAYNIKIMKDDSEVVMGRIAVHEIVAVSYLHDDDQHLVIIKAGNNRRQKCTCYVFHCKRGRDAEEICNLIGQIFDIVYTEATMNQLDTAIVGGDGAIYSTPHRQVQTVGSTAGNESQLITPHIMEQELFAVDQMALTAVGQDNKPSNMRANEVDSDSEYETDDELSNTSQQMVQDYMQMLGKTLQQHELKHFAELLTTYRQGKDINTFFSGLQSLYGEERKFLLPGMHSFIPAEHREEFEQFLVDNGVHDGTGSSTDRKAQRHKSRRPGMQRAKSKRSGAGPPRLSDVQLVPGVPEHPETEEAPSPPPQAPTEPEPIPQPDPNDVDAMLQSIQTEMDDMTASFS